MYTDTQGHQLCSLNKIIDFVNSGLLWSELQGKHETWNCTIEMNR